MALSSDDDVSGLTQSTFRANDELDQSKYDILGDIFQTEPLLDISVEEQSFLSKNTSESRGHCTKVEKRRKTNFRNLKKWSNEFISQNLNIVLEFEDNIHILSCKFCIQSINM